VGEIAARVVEANMKFHHYATAARIAREYGFTDRMGEAASRLVALKMSSGEYAKAAGNAREYGLMDKMREAAFNEVERYLQESPQIAAGVAREYGLMDKMREAAFRAVLRLTDPSAPPNARAEMRRRAEEIARECGVEELTGLSLRYLGILLFGGDGETLGKVQGMLEHESPVLKAAALEVLLYAAKGNEEPVGKEMDGGIAGIISGDTDEWVVDKAVWFLSSLPGNINVGENYPESMRALAKRLETDEAALERHMERDPGLKDRRMWKARERGRSIDAILKGERIESIIYRSQMENRAAASGESGEHGAY
jgi:hypothetical protein